LRRLYYRLLVQASDAVLVFSTQVLVEFRPA